MNNASPTTEFITGGNRRIGFQLIKHISVSPNNVVISSIRGSVLQAKNKQLQELMKGTNNIHIAQLDIVDAESIDQLESEIRIIPFVDGIDVFISSAAISDAYYEVLNVPKKGFIAVAFHPGLVTTDMGQCGIDKMKGADADFSAIEVLTPEQSAKSLIYVFEKISVEDNGKFYNYDGNETVF